jgi:hypothetical protein
LLLAATTNAFWKCDRRLVILNPCLNHCSRTMGASAFKIVDHEFSEEAGKIAVPNAGVSVQLFFATFVAMSKSQKIELMFPINQSDGCSQRIRILCHHFPGRWTLCSVSASIHSYWSIISLPTRDTYYSGFFMSLTLYFLLSEISLWIVYGTSPGILLEKLLQLQHLKCLLRGSSRRFFYDRFFYVHPAAKVAFAGVNMHLQVLRRCWFKCSDGLFSIQHWSRSLLPPINFFIFYHIVTSVTGSHLSPHIFVFFSLTFQGHKLVKTW